MRYRTAGHAAASDRRLSSSLGYDRERHVAARQTGPTPTVARRVGNRRAEVGQHREQPLLFLALSGVVVGPILGVGDLDFLGHDGPVQVDALTTDDIGNGDDVLARPVAKLEVRAVASPWLDASGRLDDALGHFVGGCGVRHHPVGARAALRGNDPTLGVPSKRHRRCDFHAPEFPTVHPSVPPSISLLGIYHRYPLKSIPRRYINAGENAESGAGRSTGEDSALGLGVRTMRPPVGAARHGSRARRAAGLSKVQVAILEPPAPNPESRCLERPEQVKCQGRMRGGGRDWTSISRVQNPVLYQLRYTPPDGSWGVGPQTRPPRSPVQIK